MNSQDLLNDRNTSRRGVTLLELLLVITIMSTLSVMTASFYSRFFVQNAVDNTVDQLVGQIRKAQFYAMMGKQSGGNWGVNFSSNTITLYQGNTFGTRNAALDEKFSVNANISLGAFSDINFTHATGLPASSQTINIMGPNNTTKTVTVNAQGVVSR